MDMDVEQLLHLDLESYCKPIRVFKRQKKKAADEIDLAANQEHLFTVKPCPSSRGNGSVKQETSKVDGTDDDLVSREKSSGAGEAEAGAPDPAEEATEKLESRNASGEESDGHRNSKMSRLVEVATSEFHNEEMLLLRECGEVEVTTAAAVKEYQRRKRRADDGDGGARSGTPPRKKQGSRKSSTDLATASDGDAKGGGEEGNEVEAGEDEYNLEEEEDDERVGGGDEGEEDDDDNDDDEKKPAPRRGKRSPTRASSPKPGPAKAKRRGPGRPRKSRPDASTRTVSKETSLDLSVEAAAAAAAAEEEEEKSSDQEQLKTARGFERVYRWLQDLELLKYADCFEKHEVEDDVLPLLTLDDLREMGISTVGARRKMFTSIQDMEPLPRRKSR